MKILGFITSGFMFAVALLCALGAWDKFTTADPRTGTFDAVSCVVMLIFSAACCRDAHRVRE